MPCRGAAAIPSDADWLDAAARLSVRGRPTSRPNPSVGALVVRAGRVIGRGWTCEGGRPHAEALALEQAGDAARGAEIFVTLEPCAHRSGRGPACADLLAQANPARVIVGCIDPDPRTAGKGIARLREAGIETDLLDSEVCRASMEGYLLRARTGRPHVTLKLATSLDGRIALADGASRWITGESARAHVHSRRAMADAILVGGRTWRADAPALDVRLPGLEHRSPRRLVLTRGSAPRGAEAIAEPSDLRRMTDLLHVYVEGGATTAASFLAADMVDRLEIYRAPILIGEGRPALGDIGLTSLADAHDRWTLIEERRLGSDRYAAYRRKREE